MINSGAEHKRRIGAAVLASILLCVLVAISVSACFYVPYSSNTEEDASGTYETRSKRNERHIHLYSDGNPVHYTVKTWQEHEDGSRYIITKEGNIKMEPSAGTFVMYWGDKCPICDAEEIYSETE